MIQKSHSKLNTVDKVIKTIYFLAYILWNAFLIVVIVRAGFETYLQNSTVEGGAESNIGYAFTVLILGVIYGGIGNVIIACIALIGLMIAICNKGNPDRKKSIITYVFLILLPLITQGLIVVGGLYIPELLL